MKKPSLLFACALVFALAGCSSSDVQTTSSRSLPSVSSWTCSDNNRITVRRSGGGVLVSDSRGVEAELPADPPGQRVRFGKTGFALVLDGRSASWFVSGKRPADCSR